MQELQTVIFITGMSYGDGYWTVADSPDKPIAPVGSDVPRDLNGREIKIGDAVISGPLLGSGKSAAIPVTPCPFCGGTDICFTPSIVDLGPKWSTAGKCNACGAYGPETSVRYDKSHKAADAAKLLWNHRRCNVDPHLPAERLD